MLNLLKYFKNPFDTGRISDDSLKKFAEIHIQRLTANNGGGEFTEMITGITNAYNAYFGSATEEDTKFAQQQGLTITVNNIVDAFKAAASRKEGLIRSQYGKDSSEYQEFFPLGITEYRTARLSNIESLMTRFVAAATSHVVDLGQPLLDEFTGYLDTFKNAREAQLEKIGEVAESKSDSTVRRDEVETELFRNLHKISAMFPGGMNRCMDFFDQSFIRSAVKVTQEEGTTP
jgi:hypothetical protein